MNIDPTPMLRLTMTPGLGPVLITRALAAFGSPEAVLGASEAELARIRGIGPPSAAAIVRGMRASEKPAEEELRRARDLGVAFITINDPDYPPLLARRPDAPPLLYVRGQLRPHQEDRYPVAIVGSRRCTAYGLEQAARFGGTLASAGLTIVSGGARGIDAAAHKSALQSMGRTIAVLGCGLGECYPPEHADLYQTIAEGRGAVISELPLRTPPDAGNFPARNRILAGLSLAVLVIEAGEGSGALITAQDAVETLGRDVMALPGRVDSPASRGSLELIKSGAIMVTDPGDVLNLMESSARHHHVDLVHADKDKCRGDAETDGSQADAGPLFRRSSAELVAASRPTEAPSARAPAVGQMTDAEVVVLRSLEAAGDGGLSLDQLASAASLEAGQARSAVTLLEIKRFVRREGPRIVLAASRR